MLSDLETPVSAYLKLCRGEPDSFLLESGETVERLGRFSVVAWDPLSRLRLWPDRAELAGPGGLADHPREEFFALARAAAAELDMEGQAGLPGPPVLPFVGALVGYLGYDVVRLVERLPPPSQTPAGQGGLGPQVPPQADLCAPSRFVIFDHLERLLTLTALGENEAVCTAKLDDMVTRLASPLKLSHSKAGLEVHEPSREHFLQAVATAKEHIMAGDIFQVVLSGQFTGLTGADPLDVYRWLRVKSPSPYMFFMNYGPWQLVGASPETLVKVEDGKVGIRPIAGTRGRGADLERDLELEREMLGSEKERAEHVMLVDLARNDAGRVCAYGTIKVEPYMSVERYSHVMHIVSEVTGELRPELDIWDALKAGFPAGTVSGAPKVRAMEIIDALEEAPRGPYGGAVGFFGPGRRMDTCIAIRMLQFAGGGFTLQAGAGIVADSVPEMEYQEIEHKAAQGIAALKAAAEGWL
jgi:anthranilate synthase component 1